MQHLRSAQGEKPGKAPREGMGQQDGSKAPPYKNKPMTREEPYQTRYFTVTISSKETKVNVDQVSAVQEDTAKTYMETVKKAVVTQALLMFTVTVW